MATATEKLQGMNHRLPESPSFPRKKVRKTLKVEVMKNMGEDVHEDPIPTMRDITWKAVWR